MQGTKPERFDIAFIGLGAANSLLAMRLSDRGLLQNKRVVVIDPTWNAVLERTFCFWSTPEQVAALQIDNLVSHSWHTVQVPGIAEQCIAPMHYYHVGGAAVRENALHVLNACDAVFLQHPMQGEPLRKEDGYLIHTDWVVVVAEKVFDSRPPGFSASERHQAHLLQSFRGWMVSTPTPCFDPAKMVLMDFNVPQSGATQFMYLLPFSEHSALVELTRFGRTRLTEEEAFPVLHAYVSQLDKSYSVTSKESGVIPMSSCAMDVQDHGPGWIPTGTRAELLKPTTGYAFHDMAADALFQADHFSKAQPRSRKPTAARFAFYDRLLLKILEQKPEQGKRVFRSLFRNTSISTVLHFLKENTRLSEEARIFSRLPIPLFLGMAAKECLYKLGKLPTPVYGMLLTSLFLCFSFLGLDSISWTILGAGFLVVGLTHGALDHLTSVRIENKGMLLRFVIKYLFKGALLGVVWMLTPVLALVLFILYSAWHFGQADYIELKKKHNWKSIAWGLGILLNILLLHSSETVKVLDQIPGLNASTLVAAVPSTVITLCAVLTLCFTFILAVRERSLNMLMTVAYVLASGLLPLLISFGIYFVAQHSMNGWRHLISGLEQDFKPLFIQSLPFSMGAALIILLFMLSDTSHYTGIFFILLSCLSIPHVFSMHHFYRRIAR